jgi:hypothetical protein
MKEHTLGLVLAHGSVRNTCARHEPVWLQSCDRLVYFSPIDDCVSLPGRVEYSVGRSAAYSAHTNQRCREALRFGSLSHYPFLMLIEYDSLFFGKWWEEFNSEAFESPAVVAPQFHDPKSEKFRGKFYLHFPQVFSRVAATEVVEAMDAIPLDAEGGFTDRYVGYATELAKVDVCDLNKTNLVFTRNHITEADLPEAKKAYAKGARWSHGVKDEKVFEALRSYAP